VQVGPELIGRTGAQDCHESITCAAADHGHCRKNSTSSGAGWVRKVNSVTTPKLPPPPPRQAQNKPASTPAEPAEQSCTAPSAVTICTPTMLSQLRPNSRDTTPTPPPSASPAIPTVGHDPPGTASPCAASWLYRSISSVPAPTRTVPAPASTLTRDSLLTSITSPVELDQPP